VPGASSWSVQRVRCWEGGCRADADSCCTGQIGVEPAQSRSRQSASLTQHAGSVSDGTVRGCRPAVGLLPVGA